MCIVGKATLAVYVETVLHFVLDCWPFGGFKHLFVTGIHLQRCFISVCKFLLGNVCMMK